jgi:hypothetical protein
MGDQTSRGTATVKVTLGDMFDGPSDLIVLPCSTVGTVNRSVALRLVHYGIPNPPEELELGEILTTPFVGGENIAQFAAFAASVEGIHSSPDAIIAIGEALGRFTVAEASVRSVFAPLLGAGAGGLDPEVALSALRRGFVSAAARGAALTIHVLRQELFERLKVARTHQSVRRQVRVFISHTSGSNAQLAWVKELALFLIENDIQARLDCLHLRKGMDLPQWMCNELSQADKVVVVCDEQYKRKADGRLGGVGWETMIIQGDLARLPPDSTKYQVVVRSQALDDGLPLYLKTRYAFHVPQSSKIQSFADELLRELLDLPLDERVQPREFTL